MSRQIGIDTIHLRPTSRLGHTEYSMNYHTEYLASLGRPIEEAWDYDLIWHTDDGPIDWSAQGRCTDMGHAVYATDGSDLRGQENCPFTDPEEVYAFDPVREYGLAEHAELVAFYEDRYQRLQAAHPEQVVSGGYYKSVVSGAIQIFGWDMLLMAAADPERFAAVLERIGRYTLHHARAWSKTSIEVYIQHDDMVWTSGPFMDPAFYREAIFPLYKKMWEPLKRAGKKVLYCSDGTFSMFMDDIAACGADGFIFEPSNDLADIVRRFGRTHCLVGSTVDCRTMTFGTWEQVRTEIDAGLALAKTCPGFIWAVGNHIPANVPDAICDRYIDYLRAHWNR